MDLFESAANKMKEQTAPLASRMRPETIDEIVGQQHILGHDKLLYRSIKADKLSSIILYGPPGTGKTTLAMAIAHSTSAVFRQVNATIAGKKDMQMVVDEAKYNFKAYQKRTILFIDEIHRFNKSQQDFLLPYVEDGTIILIGATTENPFFEVNGALLSRSRIFELRQLSKDDMKVLLRRALNDKRKGLGNENAVITEEAENFLAEVAGGDARSLLNAIELGVETTPRSDDGKIHITLDVAQECIQKRVIRYDKDGSEHHDAISAFIESMKHADPDATIYYLARMLAAGEDPKYIARRICVCASEDIGLADSNAIVVATNAFLAAERVGMPECAPILCHAALYVCCAPKSDVAFVIRQAMKDVQETGNIPIPNFLRDSSYKNAYRLGHGVGLTDIHQYPNDYYDQDCMPPELKGKHYFHLKGNGDEKRIAEYLKFLKDQWNNNNK